MRVYFCRSKTLPSLVVRGLTWSAWSHVGIDTGEGTVLEAAWPVVREVPTADFMAGNGTVVAVEFALADPAAALAWGRAQVGKPYDLLALVGVLVHRDWRSEGKWFCSEFLARYAELGRSPMFRPGVLGHVFPQHEWMLPGVVA